MNVKNKADINCLVEFGLTNYEARIYLSLMRKNQLSATEIARIAKIPRPRVYDDLRSLEARGLCQVITGKKKLFSAVAPSRLQEILVKLEEDKINLKREKLESKIKQDKDALAKKIRSINSLVERMSPIYADSGNEDLVFNYVELMKDLYQSNSRFEQLLKQCKKEILSLVKLKIVGLNRGMMKGIERQVKSGTDIMRNGLSSRCIYEVIADKEEHNKLMFEKIIDKFVEAGEQAKVMKDLPMRMAIFDEKISMFTLVDEMKTESSYITQVVRNQMMARSLKMLFESLWEKAEDYHEYRKRLGI